MRTTLPLLLAAGVLAAVPAAAGVYFTTVTTIESDPGAPARQVTAHGWAEGDRAKVEVDQSDDPVLKAGLSLMTFDGGATVYLVDPTEKTFTQVDLGTLLRPVGRDAGAAPRSGVLELTYADPDVLTLADEESDPIAGLPTRHLRFRTSYTCEQRSMGLRQTFNTVVQEDLWVANELDQAALRIWLRRGPESTGDAEFDEQLTLLRQTFAGTPLKRVVTTTKTDRRGASTVVKTSTVVGELRVEDVPPAKFNMGSGYREKPMARTPGRPDEPAQAPEPSQQDEQYPFDQMLDPNAGQPVQHPQPGTQPGAQPGVQPGNPPAQPVEPQPPQEDPEYPFELMLDTPDR